jgi:hypothetical protein
MSDGAQRVADATATQLAGGFIAKDHIRLANLLKKGADE